MGNLLNTKWKTKTRNSSLEESSSPHALPPVPSTLLKATITNSLQAPLTHKTMNSWLTSLSTESNTTPKSNTNRDKLTTCPLMRPSKLITLIQRLLPNLNTTTGLIILLKSGATWKVMTLVLLHHRKTTLNTMRTSQIPLKSIGLPKKKSLQSKTKDNAVPAGLSPLPELSPPPELSS